MEEDCNNHFTSLDLYDDLITTEGIAQQATYDDLVEKHKQKHTRVKELEDEVAQLKESESKLIEKCQILEQNISKLFLTARLELQRKEKEINSLRNQLTKVQRDKFSRINSIKGQRRKTRHNTSDENISDNNMVAKHRSKRKLSGDSSSGTELLTKKRKVCQLESHISPSTVCNGEQDIYSMNTKDTLSYDKIRVMGEKNAEGWCQKPAGKVENPKIASTAGQSDQHVCEKKKCVEIKSYSEALHQKSSTALKKTSKLSHSSSISRKLLKVKEIPAKHDLAKQLVEKSKRDIRRRSGGTTKSKDREDQRHTRTSSVLNSTVGLHKTLNQNYNSDRDKIDRKEKSSLRPRSKDFKDSDNEKSQRKRPQEHVRGKSDGKKEDRQRNEKSLRESSRGERKLLSSRDSRDEKYSRREVCLKENEDKTVSTRERSRDKDKMDPCQHRERDEKYERGKHWSRNSREKDGYKERKRSSKEKENQSLKSNQTSDRVRRETDQTKKSKSRSPSHNEFARSEKEVDSSTAMQNQKDLSSLKEKDFNSRFKSDKLKSTDMCTPESRYKSLHYLEVEQRKLSSEETDKKSKSESKKSDCYRDYLKKQRDLSRSSYSEKKVDRHSDRDKYERNVKDLKSSRKKSESVCKDKKQSPSHRSRRHSRRHLDLYECDHDSRSKHNSKNSDESLKQLSEDIDLKSGKKKNLRKEKFSDTEENEDWLTEPEVWFGEEDTCTEDDCLTEDDRLTEDDFLSQAESHESEEEYLHLNREFGELEKEISEDATNRVSDAGSKTRLSDQTAIGVKKSKLNDANESEENCNVSDLYSDVLMEYDDNKHRNSPNESDASDLEHANSVTSDNDILYDLNYVDKGNVKHDVCVDMEVVSIRSEDTEVNKHNATIRWEKLEIGRQSWKKNVLPNDHKDLAHKHNKKDDSTSQFSEPNVLKQDHFDNLNVQEVSFIDADMSFSNTHELYSDKKREKSVLNPTGDNAESKMHFKSESKICPGQIGEAKPCSNVINKENTSGSKLMKGYFNLIENGLNSATEVRVGVNNLLGEANIADLECPNKNHHCTGSVTNEVAITHSGNFKEKSPLMNMSDIDVNDTSFDLEDLNAYKKELELQLCKEATGVIDIRDIAQDGNENMDENDDIEDGEILTDSEEVVDHTDGNREEVMDHSDGNREEVVDHSKEKSEELKLVDHFKDKNVNVDKQTEKLSDKCDSGQNKETKKLKISCKTELHGDKRHEGQSKSDGFDKKKLQQRKERFSKNKDCIRTSVIVLKDRVKEHNISDSEDNHKRKGDQNVGNHSRSDRKNDHRTNTKQEERREKSQHRHDQNERPIKSDRNRESKYDKLATERNTGRHSSDKHRSSAHEMSLHVYAKSDVRSRTEKDPRESRNRHQNH